MKKIGMPYILSEADLRRIKNECKARISEADQAKKDGGLKHSSLLIAVSAAAVVALGVWIFNPITKQTPYEKYMSSIKDAPKECIEEMCADMIYYDDEVNTKCI